MICVNPSLLRNKLQKLFYGWKKISDLAPSPLLPLPALVSLLGGNSSKIKNYDASRFKHKRHDCLWYWESWNCSLLFFHSGLRTSCSGETATLAATMAQARRAWLNAWPGSRASFLRLLFSHSGLLRFSNQPTPRPIMMISHCRWLCTYLLWRLLAVHIFVKKKKNNNPATLPSGLVLIEECPVIAGQL